jgi:rod shape-determining protein MreC
MALYRRTRNIRLLVVSLVMLSLLTITVDYRGGNSGPLALAGDATLQVVGALQTAVRKVSDPLAGFFGGISRIGSLQSDNARLRERLRALERQQNLTVSDQRELDLLRTMYGLEQQLSLRGVGANVIGFSVGNFEWSVTINRGSSDGLKVDMPVVSGDGLVGRVVSVAPNWSKVMLVTDPRSSVAARLAGSGHTGLIVGQTDRRDLSLQLVKENVKVEPSEQVVTSGYQGGLYPPGIPIGVVSHAYLRPGDLVPDIAVRPAVDFSSLEFVLVVTSLEGRRLPEDAG